MVSASEAADEYRSVLSDLTRNDKTQINLLTILAEDYASYSEQIVAVIEEMLNSCAVPLKIVMLYVVDSIVKNTPVTGGYRDLFAKKIVGMIVHVFKESDEKTRASIYRLRCTWTDIFPRGKLYMIDTRLNAIDKAWPIMNPNAARPLPPTPGVQQKAAGQGHVVHVNPRFLNGKTTPQPQPAAVAKPGPSSSSSSSIKVKQEPIEIGMEDESHAAVSSTTPETSTSGSFSLFGQKSPEKPVKKEKPEEEATTTKEVKAAAKALKEAKREAKTTKDGRPVSAENVKKEPKLAKKSSSDKTTTTTSSTTPKPVKEKRKSKEEGGEKRKRLSEPLVKKLKQDTGRIPKKQVPQQQQQLADPSKPKPVSLFAVNVPPPGFAPPQQQQTPPTRPPRVVQTAPPPMLQHQQQHGFKKVPKLSEPFQKVPEPTAALGAHAFGRVSAMHSTPLGANTPPSLDVVNAMAMDTTISPSMAPLQLQPVQMQPIPPLMDASQAYMTPVGFPAPPQHNIQNVTPRLPGVPENNRIFVDGKAYEVFYLDEVAVIERNGLPHRVSFAGPPRDVIIDGTAHRMAFGEHKQVPIDGDMHLLRFGAPSRELYMGNYPFKGAFGGPPIIATINARRHEIRLCGPPPEVRIDPEPSYELMRYMPAIRQQQSSSMQMQMQHQQVSPRIVVEQKREPTFDVTSLLKRLKNSGILMQVSEAERKTRERLAALEAKGAAIGRSNSPPVPCAHRLDHIERRATPMAGFDQFSMRSLVIRYDSIIDSVHRQRKSCQHCGIGFQELYGEAYQRHVDWHLQDTLRMKDPRHKYTHSQPWYMLEDWFRYSETELVNSRADATQGQAGMDESKGSPQGQLAVDENRDAPSDSVQSKECQVCHEQFEEYWDAEEDVWRLRDCHIFDGKAFHMACHEDEPGTGTDSAEQMMGQELEQDKQQQQLSSSQSDDFDLRGVDMDSIGTASFMDVDGAGREEEVEGGGDEDHGRKEEMKPTTSTSSPSPICVANKDAAEEEQA